jgi:hypothetical protein
MRAELSPNRKKKKQYARKKEEERWVKAAGEVKIAYKCICEKNPEACRAEEHPLRRED